MQPEFAVHLLNDEGKKKAVELADRFSALLGYCRIIGTPSRELSLTATKLEEACFYAKKAMAIDQTNQQVKEITYEHHT